MPEDDTPEPPPAFPSITSSRSRYDPTDDLLPQPSSYTQFHRDDDPLQDATSPRLPSGDDFGSAGRTTRSRQYNSLTARIRQLHPQLTSSQTPGTTNTERSRPSVQSSTRPPAVELEFETTAEEQENKGRHIKAFHDMITDIEHAPISPSIALDALYDLLSLPRRRSIRFQVCSHHPNSKQTGRWLQAKTLEEVKDGVVTQVRDSKYHIVHDLSLWSSDQAQSLVRHGFAPILERVMVTPYEFVAENASWLRTAALMRTTHMDDHFLVDLPSPQLILDTGTGETILRLTFDGYDPDCRDDKSWSFCKEYRPRLASRVPLPFHPLAHKFRWSLTLPVEKGNLDHAGHGYKLAKAITAAVYGFLGERSTAERIVDTLLLRYDSLGEDTLQQDTPQIGFDLSSIPIEDVTPWMFRPGRDWIKIVPKPNAVRHPSEPSRSIKIRRLCLQLLLQVLDAMLMELMTGGDLREIFDAGAKTVDVCDDEEMENQGLDLTSSFTTGVAVNRFCAVEDRVNHWHTCAGCLHGRVCQDFGDDRSESMLCCICTGAAKPLGWRLKEMVEGTLSMIDNGYTVRDAMTTAVARDLHRACIPDDEQDPHIEQAWQNLVRRFGTKDPTRWYDIYLKNTVLEEDVGRDLCWNGKLYNPTSPSVEAVKQVFVHEGKLHYHIDGNLGVTSVSVNRIAGAGLKSALKAIRQFKWASNRKEERSAVLHVLLCSVVGAERIFNARIPITTVGTNATPYLEDLSQSEFEARIPRKRYVPNDIALNPLGTLPHDLSKDADWRPENYKKYLRHQIEAVAHRYNLSDSHNRKHWTLNNDATEDHEVPFPFSKLSVVLQWTWYMWYMWCCHRLSRMKVQCDNHSNARYHDNPESRRRLNVEKFMLTVLHLFMKMLDDSRSTNPKYSGYGLRAVDRAGFEFIANIRNFLTASVSHFMHGAVMRSGYDVAIDFPTEHGVAFFVHQLCNIRLETWLANVARFSSNDFTLLDDAVAQFANLRVEEEDFLAGAPRPYLPGGVLSTTRSQFDAAIGGIITAADEEFCFSKTIRNRFNMYLSPPQVPELDKRAPSAPRLRRRRRRIGDMELDSDTDDHESEMYIDTLDDGTFERYAAEVYPSLSSSLDAEARSDSLRTQSQRVLTRHRAQAASESLPAQPAKPLKRSRSSAALGGLFNKKPSDTPVALSPRYHKPSMGVASSQLKKPKLVPGPSQTSKLEGSKVTNRTRREPRV